MPIGPSDDQRGHGATLTDKRAWRTMLPDTCARGAVGVQQRTRKQIWGAGWDSQAACARGEWFIQRCTAFARLQTCHAMFAITNSRDSRIVLQRAERHRQFRSAQQLFLVRLQCASKVRVTIALGLQSARLRLQKMPSETAWVGCEVSASLAHCLASRTTLSACTPQ